MYKKIISLFILAAIVSSLSFAGSSRFRVLHDKKSVRIDESSSKNIATQVGARQKSPSQNSPYDLTWVMFDSMPNVYGPSSTDVDPLCYDPWTNALAMIHRGHRGIASDGSTGSMWYDYSLDQASTWTRTPSQLNAEIPITGRYPSCSISNPSHGSDPAATIFEYSYPQLNPSAFGFVCYGLDPFMAGTPFSVEYQGDNTYSSQTYNWTSDDGQPNVYFLVEKTQTTGAAFLAFWRTTNQGETWEEKTVWDATNWASIINERGHCKGNTIYVEATVNEIGTTAPVVFVENKSTDNGETWSGWTKIDWRTAPELSQFDDMGTLDGRVSHDFVVDADGMEHFFFSALDTNEVDSTKQLKVVELYNSANGWHGNILATRTTTFSPGFAALTQMDNELFAAISEDRMSIAVKWVDAKEEGMTAGDIFARARKIDGSWGSLTNLTNTNDGPHQREMSTHLANRTENADGNSVTIYLTKMTQLIDVPDDSINDTNPTAVWAAKATISLLDGVSERESGIPQSINLYRNYPNPFNPSTKIAYDLSKGSNVSLKVFDVTGKEVVTLYNGYQQAGKYEATFDASKFASGVYFYTLTADNFSATEKMILSK